MSELQDFVGELVLDIQRIRMECSNLASSRAAYFGISSLLNNIGYNDKKPRIQLELPSGTCFVTCLEALLGTLNDEAGIDEINSAYGYIMAYATQTQLPNGKVNR